MITLVDVVDIRDSDALVTSSEVWGLDPNPLAGALSAERRTEGVGGQPRWESPRTGLPHLGVTG
ncbi:hypothetical protein GCM10009777_37600 [Microbacterium pumilum]|uniref:Uncharacterized protein n=1 Tax=Microbacterium pumilum TaxID=344165 RepID=A0ABP5EI07_9MICO